MTSTNVRYNYPRDTMWMKFLLPESKTHGARFNVNMLLAIIEEFTEEGDTILDPFGGVGSIFAALPLKRNVIAMELEGPFYDLAVANKEHITREWGKEGEVFGVGSVLLGDNRRLLPLPQGIVDHIITSPPYGDAMKKADKAEARMVEYFGSTTAQGYGDDKAQIGNLPHQMQQWALRDVYEKCYQTLPVGGRMIVVTKDSWKAGKRVEQGVATLRTCLDAGFTLEVRHQRQCQKTGMQNLHLKEEGYVPVTLEDVQVFRK